MKYIIANWKMNMDLHQSQKLVSEIINGLGKDSKAEVIVCPPFTSLSEVSSLLKGTQVKLGAQNMHYEDSGAFTGEISNSMLKSVGCEYVIIGHSERRTIFGENDEMINKKIKKALESGLKVIFCIGESLEQREEGITNEIVKKQILRRFLNKTMVGMNYVNRQDVKVKKIGGDIVKKAVDGLIKDSFLETHHKKCISINPRKLKEIFEYLERK